MMLNVEEHIECDEIFDAVMERPRKVVRPVTMVMNRPYCEEGSHALTDQHRAYVVAEHTIVQ